LSMHG